VIFVAFPEPPERESRQRLRRAGVVFAIWLAIIAVVIAVGLITNAHG
jgi:predicted tellurium resistance membrane protein TerC